MHSHTGVAPEVVALLAGPRGLDSEHAHERSAAQSALGSAMAVAPASLFQPVLGALGVLLDRKEHDAITPHDMVGALCCAVCCTVRQRQVLRAVWWCCRPAR